jgi:hypothetical protein
MFFAVIHQRFITTDISDITLDGHCPIMSDFLRAFFRSILIKYF